jgi:hypothetical protein
MGEIDHYEIYVQYHWFCLRFLYSCMEKQKM